MDGELSLVEMQAAGRRSKLQRAAHCLFLLLLCAIPAGELRATGIPPKPVTESTLYFKSGGRNIRVDCYTPASAKPRAAILLLHGAGGTLLEGHRTADLAKSLAKAGYAAYFIHYFDRTGTLFARDSVMQENFDTWLATVRDAVHWARKEQKGGQPVGIYGYSLGAFLALASAAKNPEVAAVVEQSGGVWDGQEDRISRMPPVLIVHGKRDERVPFKEYAQPLMALLRRRGTPFETLVLPSEGHSMSERALAGVRKKSVSFFSAQLGARESGAIARHVRQGSRKYASRKPVAPVKSRQPSAPAPARDSAARRGSKKPESYMLIDF